MGFKFQNKRNESFKIDLIHDREPFVPSEGYDGYGFVYRNLSSDFYIYRNSVYGDKLTVVSNERRVSCFGAMYNQMSEEDRKLIESYLDELMEYMDNYSSSKINHLGF